MRPGTLTAAQMQSPHVNAPEAYVDHVAHQIRLYVQTMQSGADRTGVVRSTDGIKFTPGYRGVRVRRSKNGVDFEDGPNLFADASGPYVRHVGLQPFANSLRVFSTQKLMAPEHIRMGVVSLDSPWTSWSVGTTVEIIRPQTALRRRMSRSRSREKARRATRSTWRNCNDPLRGTACHRRASSRYRGSLHEGPIGSDSGPVVACRLSRAQSSLRFLATAVSPPRVALNRSSESSSSSRDGAMARSL
jgi:hypothetical protein